MRPLAAIAALCLVGSLGEADAAHHYTRAERYAGCMFGETIPLIRRGTARERALVIASDRCVVWSEGLSEADVREVDVELHRALESFERRGF